MTQPRSTIVNPSVTRWYHCISRCVRQAFLIADNQEFDRKAWIDNRLKELNSLFAVSVAGFSSMDGANWDRHGEQTGTANWQQTGTGVA